MILILGGAHQGKLSFARNTLGIGQDDIFICSQAHIDTSKHCVYALEEFTYSCVQDGIDPLSWIKDHREQLQDTVFICQDIFCGVVPMDRTLRLWRDATGKLCQYLAAESDAVYRIYCGLEQKLK